MKRCLILLAVFLMPISVHADENLSRKDAFLYLWDSVKREAQDVYEKDFIDVPESMDGYQKILYAKDRGILDDNTHFYPQEPITLDIALLWLFRTRNVSNLQTMKLENLDMMLGWYPLLEIGQDMSAPVTLHELEGYTKELDRLMTLTDHHVSYYAHDFHGEGTAFGEKFDMHDLTAAHRTLPHNTLVRVTNLENNKQVIVRINDRGPYVEGRDMDLSLASFLQISDQSRGVIQARFERIGDANLVNPEEKTVNSTVQQTQEDTTPLECKELPLRYQKRITRDVRFYKGVPHEMIIGGNIDLASTKFFVVRSIIYPDGTIHKVEQWIQPKKESYTLTVDSLGEYLLYVSTGFGRGRQMRVRTQECIANL